MFWQVDKAESVIRFSMGVRLQKMCFIIPISWAVNTQSRVTTIEILFGAILGGSGEILGIAILDFGIEIELFSSEKLENDTNFS